MQFPLKSPLKTALKAISVGLMSLPAQAQTQTTTERPDYWHYGWDWGWGHMIFGSLMMVFFWGGILLLVVLVARRIGGISHAPDSPPSRKTALDILQERFARGEIDKKEFEERKGLLSD